jgi:uncharacterized membrane protein
MLPKIAGILGLSVSTIAGSAALFSTNLVFPAAANAWFDVCNQSGENISVAFAFHEDNWKSQGWWNLDSGSCARLYPEELRAKNTYYYVYAKGNQGGEWTGDRAFCTVTQKFLLANANQVCRGNNRVWKNFIEVFTGEYSNYTMTLSD